tara:strand:+ start:594 stop:779 length:186 start_codon:yes stop_codon:yes gene_type:complete
MLKDLILIVLGAGLSSAFYYWREYKNNQEIKKQKRLNAIRFKDNQFEINADGTETTKDSIL